MISTVHRDKDEALHEGFKPSFQRLNMLKRSNSSIKHNALDHNDRFGRNVMSYFCDS